MDTPFSLQGKVVVVTGGRGLLGSAFLKAIAAAGGTGVCGDIAVERETPLEVPLDIGKEESVEHLCNAVIETHGRIDGWINNAYPRSADWNLSFEEMPWDSWRENVDDHLNGYALCAKAVLPRMRDQGHGSFINIASIYGVVAPDFSLYEGMAFTSPAPYAAIKGGIIQLTRYLASLYGASGVRVNAISPGGIFHGQPQTFVDRYAQKSLLGRMGTPEDIAPAAVFLLSDAASYMTGHNMMVDGGWTTT